MTPDPDQRELVPGQLYRVRINPDGCNVEFVAVFAGVVLDSDGSANVKWHPVIELTTWLASDANEITPVEPVGRSRD